MGLVQPRSTARLGDVGTRPTLRRRGSRDVLRRRFLGHAGKLVEEGNGKCATDAVGVGGANAKAECSRGGKKHGFHGLSPRMPATGAALALVTAQMMHADSSRRYEARHRSEANCLSRLRGLAGAR